MESFGEYLRNLREERGISLEEVSAKTKIAVANLDFLEHDRYELLPPRVFVKGFIKSYAAEVGIDQDEVLARFEEFTREGEVPDYEADDHPLFQNRGPRQPFRGNTVFTVILTSAGVLSLAILLITGVSRLFFRGGDESAKGLPAVTTVGPSGAGPPAVPIQSAAEHYQPAFTEPPPAQAGAKVLEIKAVSSAWVRVVPDIGPEEDKTMAPGEKLMSTAKERFRVVTTNAGGIRIRFDGQEQPLLGNEGEYFSGQFPSSE